MDADLSNANLSYATLRGVAGDKATLSGTRFILADLGCARISNRRARAFATRSRRRACGSARRRAASIFPSADLTGARLVYADLRDAKFDGATYREPQLHVGSDLKAASFKGAKLENTDFALSRAGFVSCHGNGGGVRNPARPADGLLRRPDEVHYLRTHSRSDNARRYRIPRRAQRGISHAQNWTPRSPPAGGRQSRAGTAGSRCRRSVGAPGSGGSSRSASSKNCSSAPACVPSFVNACGPGGADLAAPLRQIPVERASRPRRRPDGDLPHRIARRCKCN